MGSFTVRNVSFSYPEKKQKALEQVNLTVEDGEFVVICGKSGCGKSTLLQHLKPILSPHGTLEGEILFDRAPLSNLDLREQAAKIGYVLQNPDNQIVTDKVWHELAFGLESLGFNNHTIRLRVAEMASFFGIQEWFMKNVTELSGGQKQLLNLASIMAMQPEVLILDEPTSQLDPIAASEFLETVQKINNELGVTVILTEHRLEEVLPMADKAFVMDAGKIIAQGTPRQVGEALKERGDDMFISMPSAMQIYAGIPSDLPCPITVKDGRRFLNALPLNEGPAALDAAESLSEPQRGKTEPVIQLKDVWFRYEKQGKDIIKGLSFSVEPGTLHAIVGGNGTGKTTTLSLISGICRPYRGKVSLNGKPIQKYSDSELFHENLGVLPQNPQALFVKKTVRLDLMEILSGKSLSKEEKEVQALEVARLVEIEDLLESHPYDLSGGEQQRAALAKVLLLKPRILLLDEPTKGLDACFKQKLAEILKQLQKNGVTILMVSHDIEFCAKYADACSMFFDGSVVTTNTARRFFCGNNFYTTAANRMARHLFAEAVTNEDVIEACSRGLRQNAVV